MKVVKVKITLSAMIKETSTKLFQNNQKLLLKLNAAKPVIHLTKTTEYKVLESKFFKVEFLGKQWNL